MTKKTYRKLAAAIALATSFAAAPGMTLAAEPTDAQGTTEPAAQNDAAAPAETATEDNAAAAETPAEGESSSDANASAEATAMVGAASSATTATSATTEGEVSERVRDWAKLRPTEAAIDAYKQRYEGKTIVDLDFDGATDATLATAKNAVHMRTGDTYTAKGLDADVDALVATGYYYDLFPTFEEVPEGVVLTYHVLENPMLKSIAITGNTVETTDDLMGLVTLKTGEMLNSTTLKKNVQEIQEKYRADGYILAKITDLNIDKDGNLTIKINEGKIEGFKVKGNEKTKDYVILREMRQKVGEPFNAKKTQRSWQRVNNLGFFEEVTPKVQPGVEPNAVVIEWNVKERRTGTFSVGAGYSSQDGVIGMIGIGDTNFRGTGDAVNITYQFSGDDTDSHGYSFSYRRPWLDKKQTVGTFRIYNRT